MFDFPTKDATTDGSDSNGGEGDAVVMESVQVHVSTISLHVPEVTNRSHFIKSEHSGYRSAIHEHFVVGGKIWGTVGKARAVHCQ